MMARTRSGARPARVGGHHPVPRLGERDHLVEAELLPEVLEVVGDAVERRDVLLTLGARRSADFDEDEPEVLL